MSRDAVVLTALVLVAVQGVAALLLMSVFERVHSGNPSLRVVPSPGRRSLRGRRRLIVANIALSALLYGSALLLAGRWLVSADQAFRWWTAPLVLAMQDGGYYWFHRWLHRPWPMRRIHCVHHRAAHPTGFDTVYIHPVEMTAAWLLVVAAVALVGPLNAWAFAAVAAGHSIGNVFAHSGLQFRSLLAAPLNRWMACHDAHHSSGGNFAVFLPVVDTVFGTRRR